MRRALVEVFLCACLCACGSDFQVATGDIEDAASETAETADSPDPSDHAGGEADAPVLPDAGMDSANPSEASPADDAVADGTTDDGGDGEPMEDAADSAPDGETSPEAGNDAPSDRGVDGPSVTCDVQQTFYRDRDRDGYGAIAEHVSACIQPAADDAGTWSTQPGDCRDDLPTVKPFKAGASDNPVYSGAGYSDSLRPRGVSFDFDCDGVETADPTNAYGGAQTCGALSTNCGQIGYEAATPGRSAPGVNPLCGSTTLRVCTAEGLGCNPKPVTTSPYRCR